MTNMFGVFYRMTVWTKNFQVLYAVVQSIAVFVMHAKNLVVCVKSASLARIQQAPSFHVFSDSAKVGLPIFNCRFVDASPRTIFSFFRGRGKKFCFAVQTSVFNSAFVFHCLVVTSWTAIFGFVCSASNVFKFCFANFASCFLQSSNGQCHTTPTAKQGSIFSVFGDKKLFLAVFAKFLVFNSGACHATHT
jgi:hypothetical protein